MSLLSFPKDNAVRHEEYRRLVAALPCINCGRPGASQAAHPNTMAQGKFKGLKADDRLCFPLCVDGVGRTGCHTRFDKHELFPKDARPSIERFWARKTILAICAAKQWPKDLPLPDLKTWSPDDEMHALQEADPDAAGASADLAVSLPSPQRSRRTDAGRDRGADGQVAQLGASRPRPAQAARPRDERPASSLDCTRAYVINLTLPIKIESESNVRDHWRTRSKRVKSHRQIAFAMLRRFDPPTGQVLVCLARVRPTAGRDLDAHDNLRTGFKATVDGICDWLGIRDDDPRVRFEYAQRVGKAYDVDVTIEADK